MLLYDPESPLVPRRLYELLAKNEMGEIIMANPAVSDGVLVVRTLNHVYGISE